MKVGDKLNVILYKNSAPPNKVDKTSSLSKKTTVENVRFVENDSLDIMNPSVLIMLTSSGDNLDISDYAGFNYIEIPKLSRFYFIKSMKTECGLVRYDCKVDPLMSHKKDILSSTQYILRQEKYNNSPYLEDNMLPIRSDHGYIMKPFGNNVDDRTCGRVILATTGKGGNPV